jgi:predicted kinase
MVGIPGAGKSFFAEQFAESFNAPLVSFEHIRNDLFNEPIFSSDEQEIIARMASHIITELFKTNQSIVFDGSSSQRTDRALLTKIANSAGYEAIFVWVQTERVTARQRSIKGKNGIHLTVDQFETIVTQFSIPHTSERTIVISGKHTYASQLKNVLSHLVTPRVEAVSSQPVIKRPPQSGRNILIR